MFDENVCMRAKFSIAAKVLCKRQSVTWTDIRFTDNLVLQCVLISRGHRFNFEKMNEMFFRRGITI